MPSLLQISLSSSMRWAVWNAEWIRGAISSAISGPGEFEHKSLGKIIGNPELISSSGTRTRFQWVTHQASVEVWGCGWGWCTRALGPVRLPRKILGNCRARRKILGVICRKFWHRSRVHQSRPEKRRDLCHVTQPRARINVSCSRAGQKGVTGGRGNYKKS